MFKTLAGLAVVARLFFVGTASAQIVGTAHDLSSITGTGAEVCVVCHAPHNNQNAATELLWNHDPSTQTFAAYSSPSLDGGSLGPGDVSLLCLGCHDGIVTVDSYGGGAGDGTAAPAISGNAAFGADLSNDHPIGVTYGVDTELKPAGDNIAGTAGDGGTYTVTDLLFGAGDDIVECGSCHDVHGTKSGGSGGNAKLLVYNNDGSAFCYACHNK